MAKRLSDAAQHAGPACAESALRNFVDAYNSESAKANTLAGEIALLVFDVSEVV